MDGDTVPWCGGCYAIERGAVQCDALPSSVMVGFCFFYFFSLVFCLFVYLRILVLAVGWYSTGMYYYYYYNYCYWHYIVIRVTARGCCTVISLSITEDRFLRADVLSWYC